MIFNKKRQMLKIIWKELNRIFKRNSKEYKNFRLIKLQYMIIGKQEDGGHLIMKF
jgi:hypothetical protein